MMNFFFTTEIILFLTVFVLRIRTSMGISIRQYKRLEYMNDKIISEQNLLFTRKGSLIECVKDCASIPNCVSVFYSKLFCKGYPIVYEPSSPNLISMQGIRYYACVEIYSGFSMTSSTDIFVQNSTTQISTINSNQESITTDVTTTESSAETTSKTTTNISVQDSTTQISTGDSSQESITTDVTTTESSPETTFKTTTNISVQDSTTQISTGDSSQESITTDVTTTESSPETTSKTTTNISVLDSTTQISTGDSSQESITTDVTTTESSPETTSQLPFSTVDTSSPLYSTTLMTTTSLQSSCSIAGALGYSWDSIYSICYKFYANELNAVESKAKCQSDDPNSRLLLVDSDNAYNFAVHIVVTNSIESIYLQGIRSGTEFVDDHGNVITYFRWNDGEPGSGEHLQTERDSRLQEASSGGRHIPFFVVFMVKIIDVVSLANVLVFQILIKVKKLQYC